MRSNTLWNASDARRTTAEDLQDPAFDMRDILAATSVEELTFAQFLEALQQYGKPQRSVAVSRSTH